MPFPPWAGCFRSRRLRKTAPGISRSHSAPPPVSSDSDAINHFTNGRVDNTTRAGAIHPARTATTGKGFQPGNTLVNGLGMNARYDQGKYWWELRACAYWQQFEQPKLIIPAISDTVNVAPDTLGFYSNNKTTIVVPRSVPYVLAILNSQISLWMARQLFASKQGGFYDFEPRYSGQFIIPDAKPTQQALIESLARSLIYLKSPQAEGGPAAAYLERLLNGLVYELFFEADLHQHKLFLFKYLAEADPPKDASGIEEFHQRVSDLNHPLRACLFSLSAVDVVRLIEEGE